MRAPSLLPLLAACVTALPACNSEAPEPGPSREPDARASHPATEAGARELLQAFLVPGADRAALTQPLRPTRDDYAAVFGEANADRLVEHFAEPWDQGKAVVEPNEGQVELQLWKATTEELRAGTGDAERFSGGVRGAASAMQPGITLYGFRFTKPGESSGTAYDGLTHVNGRWVLMPKAWRALEG